MKEKKKPIMLSLDADVYDFLIALRVERKRVGLSPVSLNQIVREVLRKGLPDFNNKKAIKVYLEEWQEIWIKELETDIENAGGIESFEKKQKVRREKSHAYDEDDVSTVIEDAEEEDDDSDTDTSAEEDEE